MPAVARTITTRRNKSAVAARAARAVTRKAAPKRVTKTAAKSARAGTRAASPAITRPQFTHCAIHVYDLPKMAEFYERALGLIRSDEGRGGGYTVDFVFFTADPTEHHQFVLVTGRPEGAGAGLVNQLSFRVESLADVRATYDRVKAAGVEVQRTVSHGNAWSIYFFDPEGNRIEVYCRTPWYIPQPHGDPFDFDKMTDAEIRKWTEGICRADAKFMTRAQWMKSQRAKLAGPAFRN